MTEEATVGRGMDGIRLDRQASGKHGKACLDRHQQEVGSDR